jgi:hypothetical protein
MRPNGPATRNLIFVKPLQSLLSRVLAHILWLIGLHNCQAIQMPG